MSSPMVNKDTLYCWKTEGRWYIGFCFSRTSGVNRGWSTYLSTDFNQYLKDGWRWEQEEPFEEPAVGHRCLLQW